MASDARRGPLAPGVAFITGGARGLGNAIGVAFAKDGARGVVLVDIGDEATFAEGKAAVEKYGAKVLTIKADVTKEDEVKGGIDQTIAEFGRIDYAANFAGIAGPLNAMTDISVEEYKKVLDVNTVGVWISMKHVLAQMIKQDPLTVEEGRVEQKGSIVNAASVNSIQGGAGTTGYTTSKHAVLGMTKAASLEARKQGVRINCVSPGFLRTKLLAEPIANGLIPMDRWEGFEKRQGRLATFDEIGDVVVCLSTPRFSLVVGHNLVIDGGYTINEDID